MRNGPLPAIDGAEGSKAAIKRVVGNIRLIGAVLLEINDDWVIQSKYMHIEGMAELAAMPEKNDVIAIPPKVAWPMPTSARRPIYTKALDAIYL